MHVFGGDQGLGGDGQKRLRDLAVDEELLGGVAHAGALALGVDDDLFGHREIGGAVHVEEAHALVVFDDRDGAVAGDEADEALAAARDEAVDVLVELEQRVERGAVGRGDELHGVGGQAGGGERLLHEGGEGGVGVEDFLAAAQDRGVAALQAEDGAVDGDVGARLVDDADHADGHAHAADLQAIGTRGFVEQFADGIGQRGDLADALGELLEAGLIESEAVDLGGGQAVGFGLGEVELVGLHERGGGGRQQVGQLEQRGVFHGGRGRGEHERRGAGALGNRGDELSEIGGHGVELGQRHKRAHAKKQAASLGRGAPHFVPVLHWLRRPRCSYPSCE